MDFPAAYDAAAAGLLLRPYRVADVPSLVTNSDDAETRPFMAGTPAELTTKGLLEWVREIGSQRSPDPDRLSYAVADPATDELLAGVVIHVTRRRDVAELVFWVCADVRDRGVGTRVARASSELCFTRGIHRVELVIRPDDIRSRHLAKAVGFQREAHLREVLPGSGVSFGSNTERQDGELWAHLRTDA
jgi:RimJ/RimL family protein N-acetyltransferase